MVRWKYSHLPCSVTDPDYLLPSMSVIGTINNYTGLFDGLTKYTYFLLITICAANCHNCEGLRSGMTGGSGTTFFRRFTEKFSDPDISSVSKTIRDNMFGKDINLLFPRSKCFKDFILLIANGMRTRLLLFNFKTLKLWSFTNLNGKFVNWKNTKNVDVR